jgi:hypothetical protein
MAAGVEKAYFFYPGDAFPERFGKRGDGAAVRSEYSDAGNTDAMSHAQKLSN